MYLIDIEFETLGYKKNSKNKDFSPLFSLFI